MHYFDSEQMIRVGDKVLYAGEAGTIVFVIDDDSYSDSFPKKDWAYLDRGIGVELIGGTLYQLLTPDEDLELANSGDKKDNPI